MNKRMLSLTLALVMLLGSLTAVFGHNLTTVEEAGKFLEEQGVLKGIEEKDGSVDLKLDEELARRDSIVMLSRLLGEEEEVKNYKVGKYPTFSDKGGDNFYLKNFGWAEENKYFTGDDEGKIRPLDGITAREYSIVLLRALGYGEEVEGKEGWDLAFDKAKELGILENLDLKADDKINRGQMALMTVNALATDLKDGSETLAEKLEIELPEDEEDGIVREVKSVDQIAEVDKEIEVKFEVNGKEYTLEEFNEVFNKDEEKYDVEFYTNSTVKIENGKVAEAKESFKYSVAIKDLETKEVLPENPKLYTNFADIDVKTNEVEKVTKVGLGNELDYITISDMEDDERTVQALEGVTQLGDVVDFMDEEVSQEAPEVEFVKSSNTRVAYVEEAVIHPVSKGKTTLTIKFKDIKDTVEFEIEVKANRKPTAIKAEDIKTNAGGTVAELEFEVLDQYGGKISKDAKFEYEYHVNGKKVEDNATFKEGKHTVEVIYEGELLGGFNVEAVNIDGKNPDKYELVFPEVEVEEDEEEKKEVKDYLDIKKGGDSLELNVEGTYDGIELETDQFHDNIKVKVKEYESDVVSAEYTEGVVTLKLEDNAEDNAKVKEGSLTVELYRTEGEMIVPLTSKEVKVINTTPKVTDIAVKIDEDGNKLSLEDFKANKPNNIDLFKEKLLLDELNEKLEITFDREKVEDDEDSLEKIVEEVRFIQRKESEEKVKEEDIEVVKTYVTGRVQIEVKEIYGGGLYEFDVKVEKTNANTDN